MRAWKGWKPDRHPQTWMAQPDPSATECWTAGRSRLKGEEMRGLSFMALVLLLFKRSLRLLHIMFYRIPLLPPSAHCQAKIARRWNVATGSVASKKTRMRSLSTVVQHRFA